MENEWDEIEWNRLIILAREYKYEEIVKSLKNRELHDAICFVSLVNNQIGSFSAKYLLQEILRLSGEGFETDIEHAYRLYRY